MINLEFPRIHWAVGPRVGGARNLPPGAELATCPSCGCSIWLDPDAHDEAESHGVPLVLECQPCADAAAEVSDVLDRMDGLAAVTAEPTRR